ncbi:MAG: ribosomal-processing cysteine protease Prp [Oscillospiraceae bacterium]|jgi:uncharacterized protein YsxB (DUF464 family)|nr:ribosomal-processing cysteine protease Prp [Oscillospiraceae bacterium]
MVRAEFIGNRKDGYSGFTISGHAMPPGRDSEYDMVCAAVSSAVYLTCNMLTEYVGGCAAKQGENEISLRADLSTGAVHSAICALEDHLREMSARYPENITIIIGG